jgi:hypothetical protein
MSDRTVAETDITGTDITSTDITSTDITSTDITSTDITSTDKGLSRRRALARLGIAAGVAYTAPTLVRLDRTANAKVLLSPCPPPGGGGKKPPGC